MVAFNPKCDQGRASEGGAVAADDEMVRIEGRLPPMLSVIAGMVDLTGFVLLGNVFTAHITGNLVVASAVAVRGGVMNAAQLWAIPAFILALALVWVVASLSRLRGLPLLRLLLLVQFALLATVFAFCAMTRPSRDPHGLSSEVAALIAVSAMACQFALLRLALPRAVSTAVMTGNLANTVLSVMDVASRGHPLMKVDSGRLKRSLLLLFGFLLGCFVAAIGISAMGDLAWSLPAALSALVVVWPGSTVRPLRQFKEGVNYQRRS